MRRGRIVPLLIALALLALPLPGSGAPQQGAPPAGAPPATDGQTPSEPVIRIVGSARAKIPIAIPLFATAADDATLREAATTLRDVVRDDLDFSGAFTIVPEEYLKMVTDSSESRVNYKEWLGIGAEALLLGKVGREPGTLVVEGRLFDTNDKKMALGKRYRGESDIARLMAHRMANEIILHYTGEPGVALSRIAYVSQVGKAKEIFLMDYDGARAKPITRHGSIDLSPAWSPDGKEIAFVSYRSGSPMLEVINSDGELRKAFDQGGELNSAPAWSPDGRFIAFSSSRDDNAEIYTVRVADRTLTRLTTNDAIDTSPTWSPDGKEIAFTSDRGGAPQIYIMDASGGNVRRFSGELSYSDAASWSPRGDKIAFTARVPGGFDIYVKDVTSGQPASPITQASNINEWPRWSPDGRHIVFASNRTGNFDIYTMDSDGSRVRRLTRGGNSHSPSWSR